MTKLKPRLILIHGSFGHPDENWFPYLKLTFGENFKIVAPQFPLKEKQTLTNWLEKLSEDIGELKDSDIVVGHSIGCAFILQLLQTQSGNKKISTAIESAILVSPFLDLLDIPEFDQVNKSFITGQLNWDAIKQTSKTFHIFHGENDPYVPITMAEEIAKNLDVELTAIKNGGHLNESAGFTEFQQIKQIIQNL